MRAPRVPRRKRTDRGREWSGSAGGTGMSPSPAAPYVNGQTGRPTKAGRGGADPEEDERQQSDRRKPDP